MRSSLVLIVIWLVANISVTVADESKLIEDEVDQHQAKQVLMHSRRLLRRMQKQQETNSEHLAECYDQLGRYTRLLLAHNSASTAPSDNLTRFVAGNDRVLGFKSYAMFTMQSELAYYLLGH